MKKIKFAVVTKANTNPNEESNWADEIAVPYHGELYVDVEPPANGVGLLVHVPAFIPGEILILDEEEKREVAGHLRNPDKWGIEYELFDNLEDAIKRAQEIIFGEPTKR